MCRLEAAVGGEQAARQDAFDACRRDVTAHLAGVEELERKAAQVSPVVNRCKGNDESSL